MQVQRSIETLISSQLVIDLPDSFVNKVNVRIEMVSQLDR